MVSVVMLPIFVILFGPSLLLQTVGFFAPNWVITETCDAHGLFYRCCMQNISGCSLDGSETYLNKAVLASEATSLLILLLVIISVCCIVSYIDPDDEEGHFTMLMSYAFIVYPLCGIINLIGCIILGTEYSTSQLGWAFYLSVAAGCYILLETICIGFFLCRPDRSNDNIEDKPEPDYTDSCGCQNDSTQLILQRNIPSYTETKVNTQIE